MNLKEQLNRAIEIAVSAHMGQVNRFNGRPYIEHPLRVMSAGHTIQEKIVGALHDVVEDTQWTFAQLSEEGFPPEIIDAVRALTRDENEDYETYLLRVKANSLATRVKMSDLTDNMDIRRWESIPDHEVPRLRKYLKAYKLLTEEE